MNKSLTNFFKSTPKQKHNRKALFNEACIVLGAVLLGEGIIRALPFDYGFFIALGMILFIFGVILKNE